MSIVKLLLLQNAHALHGTDRMCRLCAEPYPKANPVYTLHDKMHILEKIDSTLAIKVNVDKDREEGYPDLICRKCCHIISTFHTYKKTVDDGMARLSQEVAKRNSATRNEWSIFECPT